MRAGILLTSCLLFACGLSHPIPDAGPDADVDGDGIPSSVEGMDDTDRDGVPDYLDTDSDGDGIGDAIEGSDDRDHDETPNYLDHDSDGNGVPDAEEGLGDADADGRLDFLDFDDDDDNARDEYELRYGDASTDSDGDGTPNLRDPDSDDDTILDGHDGYEDHDGDGLRSMFDLDSDGDGRPDAMEAGDADLTTPPADTDGDGTPDPSDRDEDNDAVLDIDELARGMSTFTRDTDGDGVDDPFELVEGTDPLDPTMFAEVQRVILDAFPDDRRRPQRLRVVLDETQPLDPTSAHLVYEAIDAEVAEFGAWFETFEAAANADGCTERTVASVVMPRDGYGDARRGDALCWVLMLRRELPTMVDYSAAQVFSARATVIVDGGVPVPSFLYFWVQPPLPPAP